GVFDKNSSIAGDSGGCMLAKLASGASRTALGELMMLAFSYKRRVLRGVLALPSSSRGRESRLPCFFTGPTLEFLCKQSSFFIPGIPDSSSQPQAQPKVPAAIFDPVRA
ncbi:hypothetical protein THAOC_26091, partial [Thalassiosira oceanica]